MGIEADIRLLAREAAREVVREELKRLESALEVQGAPRAGPERLLTVEEVAALCNVGPKTVQRWISKGLLRAMRSPGMREYRVRREDYDLFVSGASGADGRKAARPVELGREVSTAVAAALAPPRGRR
jgi:excisionase family DNA binding protein